jgi:hypothetical protein
MAGRSAPPWVASSVKTIGGLALLLRRSGWGVDFRHEPTLFGGGELCFRWLWMRNN